MSSEIFNELCLEIDTRERQKSRINRIKEFFESHGAAVEFTALPNKMGLDYAVSGFYRDVEVKLGVEYKQLWDLISNQDTLKPRLASSFKIYNAVSLVIEMGDYELSIKEGDNGIQAWFTNPAVRDGSCDSLMNSAMFEGMIESWTRDGVHVRKFRNESEFPQYIVDLLGYVTKPIHSGLELDDNSFIAHYTNVLAKLPGIGFKTAQKLILAYPNAFWLISAAEEDIAEYIGTKKAKKLYDFFHCHDLETEEWRNHKPAGNTEENAVTAIESLLNETTNSDQEGKDALGTLLKENHTFPNPPIIPSSESIPLSLVAVQPEQPTKEEIELGLEHVAFKEKPLDEMIYDFVKVEPRKPSEVFDAFKPTGYSMDKILEVMVKHPYLVRDNGMVHTK